MRGGQRGGPRRERGRLERANDPDPDPEWAKGQNGVTFIRPSLAPRPPPLCRKGTPTERKEAGEGARSGRGESKTPQEPSGGSYKEKRDTLGHEKIHLLVDLRRLGFVRVQTLVSDGASQEKGDRSSDQLEWEGI